MDVVLVSARGANGQPHWSLGVAGEVARRLVADGARLRWLCPLQRGMAVPAVPGGEVVVLAGARRPFRKVLGRVGEVPVDVVLARTLRPLRRAVVVHVGFGAPGSVTSLWIASRMGARAVAAVRSVEVLCHRGTLVDWTGADCAAFLDAARCARCSCAAWEHGLSGLQAGLARWLRPLGGWSPFPNEVAFRSRQDLVLSSLQMADVLVPAEADRERLAAAGIGGRRVRVVESDEGGAGRVPSAAAIAAEAATICGAVAAGQ